MTSISLKNGYSYNPSPENAAATHSAIDVLRLQWQPDLIDLNTEERMSLRKMGPIDFATATLGHARANPHMIPAFADLDELEKDLAAYLALQGEVRSLAQTFNMAEDSLMALGSKVEGKVLACYAGFQSARKQGQPGAELIVDELSQRFAKRGQRTKPVPPTPASGDPAE